MSAHTVTTLRCDRLLDLYDRNGQQLRCSDLLVHDTNLTAALAAAMAAGWRITGRGHFCPAHSKATR